MNSCCILILAALCSGVVSTESESTTLPSIASTTPSAKLTAKVKRQYQYPYARPPNYSPFVGDAALDAARRQNTDQNAQTINQVDQKDINGNYNYAYETTNGIKVRQTSFWTNEGRVVVGYYSYLGPDGKIYTTHYTADRHGYRATGSHLPVQDTSVQPLPNRPGPFVSSTPQPFISSTPQPFISSTPSGFGFNTPTQYFPNTSPGFGTSTGAPYFSSTPAPYFSSTPSRFGSSTPAPYYSSTPAPYYSSTPAPYYSSTSIPFGSSTPRPFVSTSPYASPFNVPSPSPYRGFAGPTTVSPLVSSSTPYPTTASPFSASRRPHFPIYRQPFQGYEYPNPGINPTYSVVSRQTPAPIFYPSSSESLNRFSPSNINSRITTTLAPPPLFDEISATTRSPFDNDEPVQFKQYIPPVPIVSSTPRPFNSFPSNQPDTVLITPKPSFQQPPLPNSLSINQNILPPYLAVGPLNSPPQYPGYNNFNNNFRENRNFLNNPQYNYNDQVRPQTVSPLTVTNLNYRGKRDFDKD